MVGLVRLPSATECSKPDIAANLARTGFLGYNEAHCWITLLAISSSHLWSGSLDSSKALRKMITQQTILSAVFRTIINRD